MLKQKGSLSKIAEPYFFHIEVKCVRAHSIVTLFIRIANEWDSQEYFGETSGIGCGLVDVVVAAAVVVVV